MSIQVTLSKQKYIKCDPALLFQRLLFVGQSSPVDLDEIMSFELSAYPLSIFEKPTLLHKADKPKLIGAIVKFVKEHSDEVSEGEGSELMNKDELLVNDIEMEIVVDNYSNDSSINVCIQHEKAAMTDIVSNDDTHQYVIDGGSLLHRISWEKN